MFEFSNHNISVSLPKVTEKIHQVDKATSHMVHLGQFQFEQSWLACSGVGSGSGLLNMQQLRCWATMWCLQSCQNHKNDKQFTLILLKRFTVLIRFTYIMLVTEIDCFQRLIYNSVSKMFWHSVKRETTTSTDSGNIFPSTYIQWGMLKSIAQCTITEFWGMQSQ